MNENFQQKLFDEISKFLEPLASAATDSRGLRNLFAEIGWDLEAMGGEPVAQLQDILVQFLGAYQEISGYIDNPPDSLEEVRQALTTVDGAIDHLRQIPRILPPTNRPPAFEDLAGELVEHLVVRYAYTYHQTLWDVATLLTIAQDVDKYGSLVPVVVDPSTGVTLRFPHQRPRLQLSRLSPLIRDPAGTLRARYVGSDGLATAADAHAVADALFPRLEKLLHATGAQAVSGFLPVPGYEAGAEADQILPDMLTFIIPVVDADDTRAGFGATLALGPDEYGGLGFVVVPFGSLDFQNRFSSWLLELAMTATVGSFAIGSQGLTLEPDSGASSVSATVALTKLQGPDAAAFLVGSTTGTRLEIGRFAINGDAALAAQDQEFGFLIEAGQAALVVAPGDGDGFLQQILPPEGLRTDFDLALGWSNRRGLHFRGGANLEATLPVRLSLFGVLNIDSVYLALRAGDDSVRAVVAAAANAKLGPVTAEVDRVGLLSDFTFPSDGGNLGPANVELDFKPPSGVGLSIDAGAVTGGGFLFFDPEEEQYAGAVHLEFEGGISLNAIGLLTTRMPDGSKGFSLLVVVTAAGFNPIQLGFGFTLNGVGGLLGVNRTVAVDVLRAGVRQRALDPILFSKDDPVPRAPQIVSTLRSVFPPAPERYIFGPMAIIGWGTPTVLTLEVAVLLELLTPLRLIVLGRLRALLPGPDERTALVKINMDVLGVVEFDRREAAIDATLYDSNVAGFAISGDMALRASWGERPGFALSVGGFHPRFQPPPAFPALRRLSISLSTADNPRLRLEAYLALTSNTVQLGARLDLYVEALGFNLLGMLSFDALVQFAPFELDLEVAGQIALRRGTRTLMGLALRMRLTGPAPWHATGEVIFQILFFKISIGFDATFGQARPVAPPAPVPIWPPLLEALSDAGNWGSEMPGSAMATVRAVQPVSGEILVHPQGRVAVRQRVVPLGRDISRFANAPPADYRRFRITGLAVGEENFESETLYEHFAPAQFAEMPDAEKLASPGFDRMPAGASAAGARAKAGSEFEAALEYETVVVGAPGAPEASSPFEPYTPAPETLTLLTETGAAGMAELRRTGRAKFAVEPEAQIAVEDPDFAVVSRDDLAEADTIPKPDGSYLGAREALRLRISEDSRQRSNLQIARREEVLA